MPASFSGNRGFADDPGMQGLIGPMLGMRGRGPTSGAAFQPNQQMLGGDRGLWANAMAEQFRQWNPSPPQDPMHIQMIQQRCRMGDMEACYMLQGILGSGGGMGMGQGVGPGQGIGGGGATFGGAPGPTEHAMRSMGRRY